MNDWKKLREDVRGMSGRFFYDAERGDIGYIAKDCDDKTCDCEVKKNADGDQDCSVSVFDDFQGEEHICELLAGMLNAVGPLLDENDSLRAELAATRRELERWRHSEQIEGDYVCPAEQLLEQRDEVIRERDSLRAEVERLRERYGWNPKDGDGVMVAKKILTSGRMTGEDIDRICRAHLEQYVQHRDVVVELCGIAERLANLDESQPSSGMIGMACMHRVREILDAIGKDGGNG